MTKTIYLNLEDDVAKIVAKLKREKGDDVVLVFPKKSFLFSDSINMRLLKKQVDMLGKQVSILTMDERGQTYAQEAGFALKHMPKTLRSKAMSDIRQRTSAIPKSVATITTGFDSESNLPTSSSPKRVRKTTAHSTPKPASVKSLKEIPAGAEESVVTVKTPRRPNIRVSDAAPLETVQKQENFFIPPAAKPVIPPKRKTYRAYIVGFVALALIIILVLLLVVLPSANVIVYAKPQSISRDINVIADARVQAAESSNLAIPANIVNESQTIADTFQTKGKKEVGSKSEGRVVIYNLTGSPMALRAATTTLTIGNKSYVFKEDQGNVKAVSSTTNDASATTADIVAVEGGESFNVPAGTRVEITNQSFGSQPQRLYAKTVTQIVGGTSRFVSVIAKEDLTEAQEQLTKRVVEGINANLASSNAKLVEGAYGLNVTSFTTDIAEGVEAQNFTAELRVTVAGLAFNESELKNMIRQRLLMTIGAGKDLQEVSKDEVVYQIKNLDTENGLMQLAIHYESNAKPRIEVKDLQSKLAGKSKQEASDLILSNADVEKVEITLQPLWQSTLPRFASKVHLEIRNE